MSEFDETADLIEWLRQPRWMEGAKQKRLFEAADDIEFLRDQLASARKALDPFAKFASTADFLPDNFIITKGSSIAHRQLTFGDCRNAAAAIR